MYLCGAAFVLVQGLFATVSGHKVSEFNKSRVALGSISLVDRSRVSDLQNPEEDKPLAAHWRVPCYQESIIMASSSVMCACFSLCACVVHFLKPI